MLKRSALVAVMATCYVLAHPSIPAMALEECGSDCAAVTVGDGDVPISGGSGAITVSFQQGPDDGQAAEGNDDTAAIAFTIGLPGTGSGNPLGFNCDGGQLAAGAVQVPGGVSSNFAVVVENQSCNGRNRCLCPDVGAGQTQDDFVNIVVYGPREIPSGGPVQIPKLPNGTLVTLNLIAGDGVTEDQVIDLPIYCEQDADTGAKPQFAATMSIGDQSAIDQTADRGPADSSRVICTNGTATIVGMIEPTDCVGDCNGDGRVAINELVLGVNIALGNAQVGACPAMDGNGDGSVRINELVTAVNNALNGCP